MKNWTVEHFQNLFTKPLPGEQAQMKLAPPYRGSFTPEEIAKFQPKSAAVMALFFMKESEWHIVFTERMTYAGVHSGQISFPGGKQEQGESPMETALRETYEEVGIKSEQVQILGALTQLYIPPSNFFVHPFAGISAEPLNFKKQESEVNQILEIPASFFLIEENIITAEITIAGNAKVKVPAYNFNGKIIWGATAIIMSELSELLKSNSL